MDKPFKLFVADWCRPSQKLQANIKELEGLGKLNTSEIEVLNVDTSDGNTEGQKYNVRGLPTLIKVDAEGTATDVIVGYRTVDQLEALFSKI